MSKRRKKTSENYEDDEDSETLFPDIKRKNNAKNKQIGDTDKYAYDLPYKQAGNKNVGDIIKGIEKNKVKNSKSLQEKHAYDKLTPNEKILFRYEKMDSTTKKKKRRKNDPENGEQNESSDEEFNSRQNYIEFPDPKTRRVMKMKFPQDIIELKNVDELIYISKCLVTYMDGDEYKMTKHMQTKKYIDQAVIILHEKLDQHLVKGNVGVTDIKNVKKLLKQNTKKGQEEDEEDVFSAKTDSLNSEEGDKLFEEQKEEDDEIEKFVKRNFNLKQQEKNNTIINRYVDTNKSRRKTVEKPDLKLHQNLGKINEKNFTQEFNGNAETKLGKDPLMSDRKYNKADEIYPTPSELKDSNQNQDPEDHNPKEEVDVANDEEEEKLLQMANIKKTGKSNLMRVFVDFIIEGNDGRGWRTYKFNSKLNGGTVLDIKALIKRDFGYKIMDQKIYHNFALQENNASIKELHNNSMSSTGEVQSFVDLIMIPEKKAAEKKEDYRRPKIEEIYVHEYIHPTIQIADDFDEFFVNNVEYKLLYPPQRNWYSEYFCMKSDVEFAIDTMLKKIEKVGEQNLEEDPKMIDPDLSKMLKVSKKLSNLLKDFHMTAKKCVLVINKWKIPPLPVRYLYGNGGNKYIIGG